VTLNCM